MTMGMMGMLMMIWQWTSVWWTDDDEEAETEDDDDRIEADILFYDGRVISLEI